MSSTNVPSSIEMTLKLNKKYQDDVKEINKEYHAKREIIFSKLNPDGISPGERYLMKQTKIGKNGI